MRYTDSKYHQIRRVALLCTLLAFSFLSGCASSQSKEEYSNDDLEEINRISFSFNEVLDEYVLEPIAKKYAEYTPIIYQQGITNFFDNLQHPNSAINSFLQGNVDHAFSSTSRFMVNSTAGVGGLIDVATRLNIPKYHQDLGQTLAHWGVHQGSYLHIPLLGPNTVRNSPNIVSSIMLDPVTYLTGGISIPLNVLKKINQRAGLIGAKNIRDEAAIDPYNFTREFYLQQRAKLLNDETHSELEDYEDIFDSTPESILRIE